MKKYSSLLFLALATGLLLIGCKTDPKPVAPPPAQVKINIPKFVQDTAYSYIEQQLNFGPRVPGSEAAQQARGWMEDKLQAAGATVYSQEFRTKHYDGSDMRGTNIIGAFNPSAKKRILLAAHWDSRLLASKDKDPLKAKQPVPGADDGASGVGVLLEIARNLKSNPIPNMGIDIVLFDLEDQGEDGGEDFKTWCLGSQHWSKNFHVPGYSAKFGILLDMVGAKGARFTKEEISRQLAGTYTNKLWKLAGNMGYSNYFVPVETKMVIDDHLFINQIAKIPTLDIINRPEGTEWGFGHYWHTHADDISVIDKRTLKAVGQVVTAVIYNEAMGKF